MQPTVVAFDVDRTLTVRDCVVPFMRRTAGPLGFGAKALWGGARNTGKIVRRDRDALKAEFVKRVFSGRSVEEVCADGAVFASEVAESWMRADVASRMRWHQDQGHVVLLVSASLDVYLEPLGDLLEVDAVLCTTLDADGDRFTGLIAGANCRGQEKVSRIEAWCTASGVPKSALEWAYGDSGGDAAMLAVATNGVLVSRSVLPEVPT